MKNLVFLITSLFGCTFAVASFLYVGDPKVKGLLSLLAFALLTFGMGWYAAGKRKDR